MIRSNQALALEVSTMSPRYKRSIGFALICALLLFVAWYVEAEDFNENRVAGTYVFPHDGITQRLTLKRDHTFEQADTKNGTTTHAEGPWRAFSSIGHMSFSRSFIDARDYWRGQDEHEVYGIFKNYWGWVSITMDDNTKAYKKPFS
jgi:hypothetical protein